MFLKQSIYREVGIQNVSQGVESYKAQVRFQQRERERKKKGTTSQNEDKLSRDSSAQSGTFASTHKERKKNIEEHSNKSNHSERNEKKNPGETSF
jgi:hypothetical protein